MELPIQELLNGFPSFVGLLICILILARALERADKRLERLVESIIKRENCEERE